MLISVIVSSYNRPDLLELVLCGYAVQTDRAFELVIADDGSGPETAAVIARFRERAPFPVVHVWHEDRGFRKSRILNRAIVASRGDYLLCTDGDCIPRADLVRVHRALREEGRYLAGGYLKLPAEVSAQIGVDDIVSGRASDLRWLRATGWRPGHRALRLVRPPVLAGLFDRLTPTAADFQGNNASVSRDAMLRVNGFEGRMGYGGLDQALGRRLGNMGVRGKQIRHRAICMHLHHDRPYRTAEGLRRNAEVKERIRREREVRAVDGIAELDADPSLLVDGQAVQRGG